jgi:topoisomerase-4 subunit A
LARLEGIRLERDLAELREEKEKLSELLASGSSLKRTVIREIEADERAYGDARRTLILEEKRTVAELRVPDEPVTVVISEKGWVRSRLGHALDPAQWTYKPGDSAYATYECRSIDHLIALGTNGRVYSVLVSALPGGRGDGVPITSLIDVEAGTQIVHLVAGAAELPLLMASSAGNGFVCRLGDMLSRVRGGKAFFVLDEGEEPIRPAMIDLARDAYIACLSQSPRLLVFPAQEIRMLAGGGRGVILQELNPAERLISAIPVSSAGVIVSGTGRGGKQATVLLSGAALAAFIGKRARKGKAIAAKLRAERLIAARPASA